jgi:nicotinate-nucleotide--dimethylbenzimidazole phosphoribosyltransferase
MRAAAARLDQLTKPQGSLGALEKLAVRLAGITGNPRPSLPRKAVFVFAADHGVAQHGVSAYPQAVTAQMVLNFLAGGAAINVLARRAGARVVVADLGVAADLPDHPGLVQKKVAHGTRSLAHGSAMDRDDAMRAIEAGMDIVATEIAEGLDLVATGDMGIGNTTASAALAAVFTARSPLELTGRGTGVDDEGWQRKVHAVERALEMNQPSAADPIGALALVGGYEIAGLVGAILAGAAHHLPVVVDGYISGAAALVAVALCPSARNYLIASHCSAEPGHRHVLAHLGLTPLLDLQLRLGEGTGAALALHLVDDALAILNEMATFAEAGVAQRDSGSRDHVEDAC